MKGSDFVRQYGKLGAAAWEAAAVELARSGDVVDWPMVPITLRSGQHEATLRVSSDLFAVGEPGDFLRLPLMPRTAQTIANLGGLLLPTPLLSKEIWKQANVKLQPIKAGSLPKPNHINRGPVMEQFAAHDAAIEAQRQGREGLVTGHKKDVVVSNIAQPGKVLIYGWFYPDDRPLRETMDERVQQPIQPRSNAHGDFYVDYSHGVRFVSPVITVDGQEMLTEAVMKDPELSGLVSDEGPLKVVRYPASNQPRKVYPAVPPAGPMASSDDVFYRGRNEPGLATQGLATMMRQR